MSYSGFRCKPNFVLLQICWHMIPSCHSHARHAAVFASRLSCMHKCSKRSTPSKSAERRASKEKAPGQHAPVKM